MIKNIQLKHSKIGIPLLILGFLAILPRTQVFQNTPETLSIAILLDLLISIPIIYFLLIRKTAIPKITIIYVLLLDILLAGVILPAEHQSLLATIKIIAIPILEIGLVSMLIFKVRSLNTSFKQQQHRENDFYDTLLIACKEVFPGRVGKILATEISVFYYLFAPNKASTIEKNEFTYFKKSGIKTVVGVFLFLVGIETFVVHLLVAKWHPNLACILTFLGGYTMLQIVAILRSMNKRLISINYTEKSLDLRYGFASQTSIPFKHIARIEKSRKSLSKEKKQVGLSVFDLIDTHNILIYLKEENVLQKIYGIEKKYTSIAVFIDDKDLFVEAIEQICSQE